MKAWLQIATAVLDAFKYSVSFTIYARLQRSDKIT